MNIRINFLFIVALLFCWVCTVPAFSSSAPDEVLSRLALRRADITYLLMEKKAEKKLRMHFKLDGLPVAADLKPHSVRASNFTVTVPDGKGGFQQIQPPPSNLYRGKIEGMPGSDISAAMIGGRMKATIRDESGHIWGLQPSPVSRGLRQAGDEYVVYSAEDAVDQDVSCAVRVAPAVSEELTEGESTAPGTSAAVSSTASPGDFIAEIAFDADYEYYVANGSSVDNVIADIESIVNSMNLIYERDVNITHEIVHITVRSDPADPYTSTNSETLLDEFDAEWSANFGNVDRDIAHLMTGKEMDGSTIGIAYLGVICNRFSGYGLSQSKWTSNFERRVALTAHEVGHNWDAEHCSSCNIMCASLGGCTGIVNSFSDSAIAQILAHRNSRSCLSIVPEALPDLSVSQSIFPASPAVRDTVTLSLVLTNASPDAATSVTLENRFPSTFVVDQVNPSASILSDRVIWSVNRLDGNESFQATVTGRFLSPGMTTNWTDTVSAEQDLDASDNRDSLVIEVLPMLSLNPENLMFNMEQETSALDVSCQSLTLNNDSDESLTWSLISAPAWISVSPGSGSVPSGGSLPVQVCLTSAAEALNGGEYNDTIVISNQTSGTTVAGSVVLAVLEKAAIPFFDGFESGVLQNYWTVTGTEDFRTRVSTDNGPAEGSWHVLMDDAVNGGAYSRNELTLILGTTGYTNWVLQFQAREYRDESHSPPSSPFTGGADFDGVAVSVDGVQWYEVQGLRGRFTSYSLYTVNLSQELAQLGLPEPDLLFIRFNQYDNFGVTDDGIGIDSVSVTGDKIPDADFDGLPDAWETNYFPSVEAAVPSVDFDGDLYTNEEEYIMDTDPVSSNSFQTFTIHLVNGIPQIGYGSSTARVYRVLQKTDPTDENWTPIQTNQPGSGSTNFLPLEAMGSRAIFRLEVEVPD